MAPTIIDLPDVGWREVTFDPVRPRNVSRMEGRRTEAESFGTPYWTGKFTASLLGFDQFGKWDAFLMQAGDDGEIFRGYDVFRPRPILENKGVPLTGARAAGGAFDGTATLDAIVSSRLVDVTGLPAGFRLSAGDYVEFRQNGQSSLHRLQAATTASAGGAVTLSFKYGLDTQHFTTAAMVRFEKPSCLMQIDAGSGTGPKSKPYGDRSFSATEVFFS